MKQSKLLINIITIALVIACIGIALYFRIALPYDKIFTDDWIKFSGTDSYFFMRVVDNLLHHFPNIINFDPYLLYPGGFNIFTPPFFSTMVAGIILIFTLGSPTPDMVDTIGVYIPAILGALTVIPVFFIAKSLFNRWAGIIAGALIAIFPGEFMGRSILGFTDQHVAETFHSATSAMFFIFALKKVMEFPDIRTAWQQNKSSFYKIVIYSVLTGLFLGFYTITWYGALLFVLVFFIYIVIQQIINHIRGIPLTSLSFSGALVFLVTFMVFITTSFNMLMLLPLLVAIILPPILNIFSIMISRFKLNPFTFPGVIIGSGIIAAVCLYLINPTVFNTLVANLNIFTWPRNTTILEMQPIFFPNNMPSINAVWGNFTTSFFLSIIALAVLIYHIVKKKEPDITFIVIWTVIILAATLSMRRFAYYFVVNAAILSGYISWLIIKFVSSLKREPKVSQANINTNIKKKDRHRKKANVAVKSGSSNIIRILLYATGSIIVFFLVLFPNIPIATATASGVYFAPSNAWCESLTWLKNNTPDPFDNPDYYYDYYEAPEQGEVYQYPPEAYSIASWWDYGYWITRIGHRIPISNPGTNHNGEAYYFMSEDPSNADAKLDSLNSKYVVIDVDMVMPQLKFHAIATLSDNDVYDYIDLYYVPQNGSLQPQLYYSSKYFKSMLIRLYNFNGAKVIPSESKVITYQEKTTSNGEPYKQITGLESFTSYEAAAEYIAKLQTNDKYAVVSSNPYSSPIPLDRLNGYELVYESDIKVNPVDGVSISEVKIFQFSK